MICMEVVFVDLLCDCKVTWFALSDKWEKLRKSFQQPVKRNPVGSNKDVNHLDESDDGESGNVTKMLLWDFRKIHFCGAWGDHWQESRSQAVLNVKLKNLISIFLSALDI